MPERSQGQIAEGLRRTGKLSDDHFDTLLAHAITELDDLSGHSALLLSLAESRPGKAVKQALFYNCNKTSEIAVPCAALLCYLCGKAANCFDPALAGLLKHFGAHVNYFEHSAGLAELTRLTGMTSMEPWEFTLLDDPAHSPVATAVGPASPDESAMANRTEASISPNERTIAERPAEPDLQTTPLSPHGPAMPKGPSPLPPPSSGLAKTFEIESEMRGETIHYIEPDRRVSMQFFWTSGYQIHADTLTTWFYPAEKRSETVTPQQRIDIVARVVAWARRVQNADLQVISAEWMYQQRFLAEIEPIKAEELSLLDSINHLGVFASLAELWRKRTATLAKAGRQKEAIAAFHRGAMWAWRYAAGATSGGEGAALSLERDKLIVELRAALAPVDPGEDPDGRLAREAIGEELA